MKDISHLRAWLYRIATNHCVDRLRVLKRERSLESMAEYVSWLQPYPDGVLAESPETALIKRETIALAFLRVIQGLPAQQRAVFLLREIQGWPAQDVADALGLTRTGVNSAFQRARTKLLALEKVSASAVSAPTPDEQTLLARYVRAHEEQDASGMIALMRDDICFSMPPSPSQYVGVAALELIRFTFGQGQLGEWKLVTTGANRQPAAASYLRNAGGTAFHAYKIDVLRIEEAKIVEIVTFDSSTFKAFGLQSVIE